MKNSKKKEITNETTLKMRKAVDELVYEIFKDRIYHGVITVTSQEIRNVLINLMVEFKKFETNNTKNTEIEGG